MIPEIGHFALAAALAAALLSAAAPIIGARVGDARLMELASSATLAQMFLVACAYAALTYAFVDDDFSVRYVAMNSNTDLPLPYKVSAVWGAHEGSMLLWVAVLAVWGALFAAMSRKDMPEDFRAKALAVLGILSAAFIAFILFTSNPFERLFPAPDSGNDLNPLLQDPGLVIHPPLLYLGYIGFSVVFAIAIAALWSGRLDADWVRWARPWTLTAWAFLTLGITLGSWWAYHELGWGGWWFWDPVENASFMPWLVGTALIHSMSVSGKRDAFKSWTVLLAITAFSLSLLGTFLVRSGVLVSVHAFASDPARGVFILIFLAIVIGVSLTMFAWRAPLIRGRGVFSLFSRENFLLLNNVLLLVAAATILLAVLYPLAMDALDLGKISVGPPYFAAVFAPLALPLAYLAGVAPTLAWRTASPRAVWRRALPATPLVLLAVVWAWAVYDGLSLWTTLGLVGGAWVFATTAYSYARRGGAPVLQAPAAFHGMSIAHIGLGVFVVGVTFTSAFSSEREAALETGESVALEGYQFTFESVGEAEGANYDAERGRIVVSRDGEHVADLYPERRVYRVQQQPMTEVAIDATPFRDLYVALGEGLAGEGHVLRVYYRPLVRWIWFGALLMALGGLVAAAGRRE